LRGGKRHAIATAMTLLVRHPDTPPGAIHTVDGEIVRIDGGAIVTFRAIGRIDELVVPDPAAPERTDNLWRHTCFELFVQGEGSAYREFNLSPSTQWAAYDFDAHRAAMREAPADVDIDCSRDSSGLSLIATIRSEIPNPAHVALTAVIEEQDGLLRYWALAFAPGAPDFHAEATRAMFLDGVDGQ
jgi:hypothetical protein